jgi:tetratricopeptide (TPR) repeat protein/transglutaminase-like putative cysteine protease
MAGGRVAAVYCAVFLGFGIAVPAADTPSDVQAISLEAMSEDVEVASDGSFIDTAHSEYRAVNEAGAMQASRISVLFDSETQQVEILEAHTLKRDGSKIPVDVNTIYEQLPTDNMLAVTSFRVKVLLFPQFSAGDTAVYTVRTRSPKPTFPGAFQFGKFFPRGIAFKGARVSVTAPKSMRMRIETHDVTFRKDERGDTIVYTWLMTAPATKVASQALVSPLDREPRLFISSFKDYTDLGRAYAAQSEPKTAVTAKIQSLANEITTGASGRREQAELIFDWVVKHIRYVAIELGQGSFVPHDPDAIIAKGYGDCKDHDVLLQALLKAKGINAESVLINGSNAYTLTEAPSFAQINHVITFVPEFAVYLDSSLQTATFGVLPLVEYGKPAVRTSLKSAGVVTIPMLKLGAATIHQTTVQKIATDGTLSGTTTTTATGPYAMELRMIGLLVQSVGAEKAGQYQMASRGFKDGTGKLIGDPLDTAINSYRIQGEFTAKGWKSVLDGDGTVMPGGLRVMAQTGDTVMGPIYSDTDSEGEATICTVAKTDEDVSLELPAGYSFRKTPDDVRIVTPNLTFVAHWTLAGNTLTVHREFSSMVAEPVCSGAVRKQTADALKRIAHSYDETFDVIRSVEHYSQNLSQNPKDAKALVNRGMAYEEAGDHEKAIADYDAALAIKPNDAWVLFQRAYSYRSLGKNDQAVEDYSKAIALDDKDAVSLGNRGRIYIDLNKYELAIADFDKALALEPDDSELFNQRGRAYRLSGQYDHAVADLTKAINLKPDNAMAHYNLAATYSSQRQSEPAIAEFSKAIALEPGYFWSYWNRAELYQMSNKFDLALKDINKALELETKVADLWVTRANVNLLLDHKDAALADVAKALALDPQSTAAIQARARIRMRSGQPVLALEDYNAILAKDPKNAFANLNCAEAYLTLRDYKRALAAVEVTIANDPKMAFAYFTRARIKQAMGDTAGFGQDVAMAVQLDPKLKGIEKSVGFSVGSRGNSPGNAPSVVEGESYLEQGRYEDAVAAFERATKQGVPDRTVLPSLCEALSRTDRLADAAYQCSRGLVLEEYDSRLLEARGTVYFRQAKLKEALEDFSSLVRIFPQNARFLYERGLTKKKMGNSEGDKDIAKAKNMSPNVANTVPKAMK